jgi:hypothetical protein
MLHSPQYVLTIAQSEKSKGIIRHYCPINSLRLRANLTVPYGPFSGGLSTPFGVSSAAFQILHEEKHLGDTAPVSVELPRAWFQHALQRSIVDLTFSRFSGEVSNKCARAGSFAGPVTLTRAKLNRGLPWKAWLQRRISRRSV